MEYKKIYSTFSTNSKSLKFSHSTGISSVMKTTSEFRKDLLKAIKYCVKNGKYDLLEYDGKTYKKVEMFLETLYDDSDKLYAPLRESGLEDEYDILMTLDTGDFLQVKTRETDYSIIESLGNQTSLYYEYKIVRESIPLYIKIMFEKHYMTVDIHGEEENF